jgi:hypothetical protein
MFGSDAILKLVMTESIGMNALFVKLSLTMATSAICKVTTFGPILSAETLLGEITG